MAKNTGKDVEQTEGKQTNTSEPDTGAAKKSTEKQKAERQVTFNQNVKFGNEPFQAGHQVKVNGVDYETLLRSGVIDPE